MHHLLLSEQFLYDQQVLVLLATQLGQWCSSSQVLDRLQVPQNVPKLLSDRSANLLLARSTLLGDD